jgi:hypothetical protein
VGLPAVQTGVEKVAAWREFAWGHGKLAVDAVQALGEGAGAVGRWELLLMDVVGMVPRELEEGTLAEGEEAELEAAVACC